MSFIIDSSIFDIDDESYLIEDYYIYNPATKKELKENIKELLFKGITDLNCICTSEITDMSNLFNQIDGDGIHLSKEQQEQLDVSRWKVENVTNMSYMFFGSKFNGDICRWEVSNVTDMSYMFAHSLFNGNISDWDVSNVTNMQGMFMFSKFNQKLNDWGKNLDERYKAFMFAGSIYDVEKHK